MGILLPFPQPLWDVGSGCDFGSVRLIGSLGSGGPDPGGPDPGGPDPGGPGGLGPDPGGPGVEPHGIGANPC